VAEKAASAPSTGGNRSTFPALPVRLRTTRRGRSPSRPRSVRPECRVLQMGDAFRPGRLRVGPGDELVVSCGGGWKERTVCASTGTERSSYRKWALSVAGRRSGSEDPPADQVRDGRGGAIRRLHRADEGFLVSVLGEVQSPGRFQVSSFHTPSRRSPWRGDQGHRLAAARAGQAGEGNGQGDRRLRLLLRGDITHDIRLHSGTPSSFPWWGRLSPWRRGSRQAIYELKAKNRSGGD